MRSWGPPVCASLSAVRCIANKLNTLDPSRNLSIEGVSILTRLEPDVEQVHDGRDQPEDGILPMLPVMPFRLDANLCQTLLRVLQNKKGIKPVQKRAVPATSKHVTHNENNREGDITLARTC